MLKYALSFLVGISQLIWLPIINVNWIFWCAIAIIYSFVFLLSIKKYQKYITLFIVCVVSFSYGIIYAQLQKDHQLKEIPSEIVTVNGRVIEIPTKREDKVKFILEVENTTNNLPVKKLLLNWYDSKQEVKPGQVWEFSLKMKPIHALYNPATFDYSKWMFRHGIDAIATVKRGVLLEGFRFSFFSQVNSIRIKIAQIIDENISSKRYASLLTALMIGDKSLIANKDSQLFQDTGTAHLIAISGLHIGLMAFIGLLVGRLVFYTFAMQQHNRFIFEAIFSIAFALIYALLAGMSIPTIRAVVMVVVFALSYVKKSYISRWNAWSFALLIVLLFDPLSVLDAGFWFSFTAVAVLMFAYTGKVTDKNKVLGFIKAQVIILIGLMPLMVLVFHQINLLTPFANFLVLPLASLLLIPLLFLSLFIYFVSEHLAYYLFLAVEKIANLVFYILDNLSQFDFLKLSMPSYSKFYMMILAIAVFFLLLPRLFRWKWVALILIVPILFSSSNDLKEMEFKLYVLDVGQGLSIIVRTKNHTLIYDTGAKYKSGFSMAQAVVIPVLHSMGVKKIEKLILSHDDNDHVGGAQDLIQTFNPVVYDVMGEFNNCQYPLSWDWDGVEFEVLSPFELVPYMGNNTSCVIKVSTENKSVLLTADIEEPVEYRLLSQFPKKIKSDVLLVPHHGSFSSSSEDFIKAVSPILAVNSSGYANQFNHPHVNIVERYEDLKIPFYDTQSSAMIEIFADNNEIKIFSFLNRNPHFWYVEGL